MKQSEKKHLNFLYTVATVLLYYYYYALLYIIISDVI